jgi:hypothetical protein
LEKDFCNISEVFGCDLGKVVALAWSYKKTKGERQTIVQDLQKQMQGLETEKSKLYQEKWELQQEKTGLQKKVKNLETTLVMKGELEKQLFAARKEAKFLIKLNFEVIVRKHLKENFDQVQETVFNMIFESI